ncbi:hypothetical protein KR222_009150 [Zaprionus bogoriensis]|nr:hypothetical protein KR222_009150 [Zaprionus bogoriensis]
MHLHFFFGCFMLGTTLIFAIKNKEEYGYAETQPDESEAADKTPGLPKTTVTKGTPGSSDSTTSPVTIKPSMSTPAVTAVTLPSKPLPDELIDLKIQHLLDIAKTGHYLGNTEFYLYLALLRKAAKLGPNSAEWKADVYEKFVSYNDRRLQLELEIEKRVAVIRHRLIHTKLGKKCRDLYLRQKRELTAALIDTNSVKEYALKLYSEDCHYKDSSEEDDEEWSCCDWWSELFSFY